MDTVNTTTRMKVIKIKLLRLAETLKPLLEEKTIFPDVEDIDVCDLIFYFSLIFINPEDEYRGNLKILLMTQGVHLDEDLFEKVHSIIFPFILFLKKSM